MLSKKTAESSTDTFLCYVGNGFGMPKAYSRPLLGATVTPNLVPWVLKKIFSVEMVKNDIRLGGASKQNALFSENMP